MIGLRLATALVLTGGLSAECQEPELKTLNEWYSPKSEDGRSHSVLACAVSTSGDSDAVYIIDAESDRYEKGSENLAQGKFVLRKLNDRGEVVWKQDLGKMPQADQRPRPQAIIVPMASPSGDIVVIGQFGKSGEWSVIHLDGEGKIVASVVHMDRGTEFNSAVLLPKEEGVLLAGVTAGAGTVWRLNLDGTVQWKQVYLSKTDRTKQDVAGFFSIAATGESGHFVVAGAFAKLNKFGLGDSTIWLMRCDEHGKSVSEAEFPGRRPSICPLSNGLFAMVYDSNTTIETDIRIRGVSLDLQTKWDHAASLSGFGFDSAAIAALPSGNGFVIAGGNINKTEKAPNLECQLCQFDNNGQILRREVVQVAPKTTLNPKVCCGNSLYFSIQTKGRVPWDSLEAGVFKSTYKSSN